MLEWTVLLQRHHPLLCIGNWPMLHWITLGRIMNILSQIDRHGLALGIVPGCPASNRKSVSCIELFLPASRSVLFMCHILLSNKSRTDVQGLTMEEINNCNCERTRLGLTVQAIWKGDIPISMKINSKEAQYGKSISVEKGSYFIKSS